MAENEGGAAAVQDQQEQEFAYPIRIEDAGPGTKRVSVEIPQERIAGKLEEQFKELRQQAAIPGFRVGHAPQKLIEKRFASDVKDQVRRSLISESYQQAVEKNNLQVIGEPQFNEQDLALPETGPLTYSFEVEVQPEITLPDLKGLTVKRPKIAVTDENVDQAMQNLREQQGTLIPVEDRGLETGDQMIADIHVKVDGNAVGHQHDAQIVVKPDAMIGGIEMEELDKKLAGLKPGEKRTIKTKVPEDNPNDVIKGKDVEIDFEIKDLKRLELAVIDQEFLDQLGFQNEKELRDALREQMEERIQYDVQQSMREQVNKYLLDNVQIELPAKLSDRQADRVVNRRAIDLMLRGIPRDQIEQNVARLRAGARDEALRELKLFFILQKIANEQEVDVDEGELNGRIAMIAAQSGKRPEKVKQEMAKDGSLSNLYIQMREQKAIDKLLENAQVEEVDVVAEKKAKKTGGKKKKSESDDKSEQEDSGGGEDKKE